MTNKMHETDTSSSIGNNIVDGMKALSPELYGPKVRRKTENTARMKARQVRKRRKRNKMARRSRRINRGK
ncbi:hypothetical protein [Phaeodactylibacter sp.]|uniref:hypothetical protein n=1 Tax=Phaeodactylibacter sp. TaxID=1940289 RepID=UPI0025F28CF1|nr:hypothetical protein [Phaeodactylibacter sp.]MCI4650836.1 hypothetical protein [Phaeodactylibacter sp.]MCI5089793.1 hypothetical protein [Phaeodactylibacter sp.]